MTNSVKFFHPLNKYDISGLNADQAARKVKEALKIP
jgi:hypothetical protein